MNPNKKISYTNTLFFTIFNAIFAIILVLLLFFRIIPSEYMYFIIGVEVGVVLIVAYCIYRIIRFEKFLEAMRNPKNLYIPFDSCPDYFVVGEPGQDESLLIESNKRQAVIDKQYVIIPNIIIFFIKNPIMVH